MYMRDIHIHETFSSAIELGVGIFRSIYVFMRKVRLNFLTSIWLCEHKCSVELMSRVAMERKPEVEMRNWMVRCNTRMEAKGRLNLVSRRRRGDGGTRSAEDDRS